MPRGLPTINARISFPQWSEMTLDGKDGRFTGVISPVWNAMLIDSSGLNMTTMTMANPGSCKETPNGSLNCTGALRLLQQGLVDVHTYPFSIDSLDPVTSVIDVVDTGFETLQAIGSIFPKQSTDLTNKVVKSMTRTVEVSSNVTCLILLLMLLTWFGLTMSREVRLMRRIFKRQFKDPILIQCHLVPRENTIRKFLRKVLRRLNLSVMTRLIETILKQPNLNSKRFRRSLLRSLLVGLFLFFCMFFTTVYCNMFGSELVLEDPIPRIDTIDHLARTNLSVIPESSGLLQQLIKSQKSHSRILSLIKDRIPSCYMDEDPVDSNATADCRARFLYKIFQQEAVYVQSLYYHQITERYTCSKGLGEDISDGITNRYHVSKEKFLPMLLMYVGRKNLSMKVKNRFKFIYTNRREYGLEAAHQKMVPVLTTRMVAASDEQTEIESCLRNKFLAILHQESEQSKVDVTSLIDVITFCFKLILAAIIALMIEIISHRKFKYP